MKPAKFKFYRRICIGNRMVSSAMWIKHARVSFSKESNLWPLLENCFKLIGWFYHHIVFPPIGSVYYRCLHCNNKKLHCYYKKLHCCLITAMKSTNHSGGIFLCILLIQNLVNNLVTLCQQSFLSAFTTVCWTVLVSHF
jgi:hypothetical protein